ncbi:nucleotide exchange factor GrpE [Fulvivirga maritima]|uniref:nucleotide exchange factor GrpE n=1 Tax=Fulvivirga maritima TaxID=2904247 RepID=UPI001F3AB9C5|nr:nucleotide exchange factor GrpE [Fulvivirga maritima]UII28695.1 nucleotide exchange factor GrpE [Fulvivirga maritima]
MKKENIDQNETPENVDTDNQETETNQEPENKQEELTEEKEEETDNTAESEVEKLKKELAESKDKYLRLYSEFDNFRRRTAKEKLDLVQTANEDLMKALLPVVDDFERAEKSFDDEKTDLAAVKEGISLISNKFKKTLEQKGLKPMEDKQGMDFDTELHEAITQIPAPSEDLKGKVVDVIEKGYLLKEKVIRYARVVVGN